MKLSVYTLPVCRHGSVLRRQCGKLCTSGFVDDVMFSNNEAYSDSTFRS